MERLTARTEEGKVIYACDLLKTPNYEQAVLERLAEIEDQIESGQILKPPCKVGDTVYYPDEVDDGDNIFFEIREGIVDCFNIEVGCKEVLVRYDGGLTYWHNFVDFGKKVFIDKNEAEEKLKELQNSK